MASTSGWTTVKPKTAKGQVHHLTKSQKKQLIDRMPRIEPQLPVQESSTLYDAFLEKEKQKDKVKAEKFVDKLGPNKDSSKTISDGANKKGSSVKKGKKHNDHHEQRKMSFEDAIKKVTKSELEAVLLHSRERFPEQQEVWLKDLVSFFNGKFESVPVESDPVFRGQSQEFPLHALDSSCVSVFSSVIKECPLATLEHLYYYSIDTMLNENQNGQASYGYRIFLQLLAKTNPGVVLSKMQQYKELVKSTQNQPKRCLSILWAVGQVGIADLRAGLRVWLDVMLPSLGVRAIANHCMDYLEGLFGIHKSLKTAFGEINLREYFHLLDIVFGPALMADLRKRLLELYPKLKKIAYGDEVSTGLRTFFPSYLIRVKEDCPGPLKKELLSCLVSCLTEDKHCYSLWCQHYTKNLAQSIVLMQHMLESWEQESQYLDQKLLQNTVQSFLRTNEQALQGRNQEEYDHSTKVCEELQRKMARSRFPWRWMMFLLVSVVLGIVSYDLYSSKTLQDSKTIRFLENYGILAVLSQGWAKISLYFGMAYSWLQVNVPHYCSVVYREVSPYVIKMLDFISHIEEYTRTYRHTAVKMLLELQDKIYSLAPDFWSKVGNYVWLSWDFLRDYSTWMWAHVATFVADTYHWIEHILIRGDFNTENIQKTLTWSVSWLQNTTYTAFEWCSQLWTPVKSH
ncbi:hypothetical protein ACJMK2_041904 [Sinanodonta woodiana]|uniref:Transmembrane protein 214 n=1 Tax=Sinanodonta woodiana TaxID=1069815 RepID=A0ABD3W7I5_SINWO